MAEGYRHTLSDQWVPPETAVPSVFEKEAICSVR